MDYRIIGFIVGMVGAIFAIIAIIYSANLIINGISRSKPREGSKFISKAKLKDRLKSLNKNKSFIIKDVDDTDLFIEWDIVDSKWIEFLGRAWLKKSYRAWILLDEKERTVKYHEMIIEKGRTTGAIGISNISYSFNGFRLWGKEKSYRYGIKEDYTVDEIYNYKFDPSDIKNLVRQIANDNGWAFGLVLYRKNALFNKKI